MTCRSELSAGQLSPASTPGRCSQWWRGSHGYWGSCRRDRCAMRWSVVMRAVSRLPSCSAGRVGLLRGSERHAAGRW